MRKSFFYVFVLLTVSVTWFSCNKENAGPTFNPQSFYYMADGIAYSGGLTYSAYFDSIHTFQLEFYDNPVQQNFLKLHFSAPGYITPGTYYAGYDSTRQVRVSMTYYTDGSHEYTSTTGSLTITAIDTIQHSINGKFQFTGKYLSDVRQITAGRFENLIYQVK